MAMRRSNMIRCPVICIVQVCRYSSGERRDRGSRGSAAASRSEAVEAADCDEAVDGHLHQVRLRQLRGRARDDRRERHAHLRASTGRR